MILDRREFLQSGAAACGQGAPRPVPAKLVVLTFDDAVKSHLTVVAPLLQRYGFNATFFVTHAWMKDRENFLTWEEIAELHRMGFEIGNHSWNHPNFAVPKTVARMEAELYLVEHMLERTSAKIPRPVSFAYTGNGFGPEAFARLAALGYRFARRGMQPEVPYGQMRVGAAFNPRKHHPLLIPTTGDAYPNWTEEHFQSVVAQAQPGQIAVLQFHGVPDIAHSWVHTPPERFGRYLAYLHDHGFRAIALKDVEPYCDLANPPQDPMRNVRHPQPKDGRLLLPVEVEASRREPRFWLTNMLVDHRYAPAEAARVMSWTEAEVQRQAKELGVGVTRPSKGKLRILPYPGGREPRLGFFANKDPHRGVKASVFPPWDPASYFLADLPEAIFTGAELLYLAHTHIPTMWDEQGVVLDNVDWTRGPAGELTSERVLPNRVAFGAGLRVEEDEVRMELWLRNGTAAPLTGLRTQVCIMLKGARDFRAQTRDNKVFRCLGAAAHDARRRRWVVTAWERCGRAWGQPLVPCLHADPVLPDCPPGQTVRVRGALWFHAGGDVEPALRRAAERFG